MKKIAAFSLGLGCAAAVSSSSAIDLKQSKLTQVVNDVQIISTASQTKKVATVNDIFSMPDVLRTGAASRAELVASDETVTRVGANTIFSFDAANRTIDLQQGSLLFHSPHGKGGGTIHTGSATASVLGTTLIITTTPSGGLKVLDLEGKVEVNFLNGLKQSLNPGQMTFILPGGNQLAPIIFFRLDELTQNSLLVKGFNQPLQSMPLIMNQINKQLTLIKSGQATDTGLVVGDDANSHQVEVLDANTIQGKFNPPQPPSSPPPPPNPPPSPRQVTLGVDATIDQSSLEDASIPTPPDHVFLDPFSLPNNPYFNGQTFKGFAGRNIFFNTKSDNGEPGLNVDISPYVAQPEFDIVAANNLDFEGGVTFTGLSDANTFSLVGGNQITFLPGITVETDALNFNLSSAQTLSLDGNDLLNYVGNLTMNSGDGISLANGSLILASQALTLKALNDISISSSELDGLSLYSLSVNGNFSLFASSINVDNQMTLIAPNIINITDSSLDSTFILMNATGSGAIVVDNSSLTANGTSPAVAEKTQAKDVSNSSAIAMIAFGSITIQNSVLSANGGSGSVALNSAFGSVNVTGTTIQAQYLTINSGDGILLDSSGQNQSTVVSKKNVAAKLFHKNGLVITPVSPGGTGTTSLTAANLITVNSWDFTPYAQVNMAANTINLTDVELGYGNVTLKSLNGVLAANPNSGAVSVPGDVNFIQNVTYSGGNPAQNYVNNGSGITVTTLK
jgi:hypothetical protein